MESNFRFLYEVTVLHAFCEKQLKLKVISTLCEHFPKKEFDNLYRNNEELEHCKELSYKHNK